MLARLSTLPAEEGLPSLELVAGPVTEEESDRLRIPSGARLPASVVRKLQRSLEAPVEELVARGVIPSGEILGRVLPQITSQIRAANIEEPELRSLYAAVYAAFRRRRSLLLLNLERQVQLEELPWISAMSAFRRTDDSAERAARESLGQVSLLAMTSFPETIIPNKLLQELRALAKASQLELPLVDELAAQRSERARQSARREDCDPTHWPQSAPAAEPSPGAALGPELLRELLRQMSDRVEPLSLAVVHEAPSPRGVEVDGRRRATTRSPNAADTRPIDRCGHVF